jgi:hypothetical protein
MTKQKYLMWIVDNEIRIKFPDEVVSVRYNPGREQQLYRMIANWQEQDGTLPEAEKVDVSKG